MHDGLQTKTVENMIFYMASLAFADHVVASSDRVSVTKQSMCHNRTSEAESCREREGGEK